MSLKRRLSEPGFVVSTLVHVCALGATLIAFSTNEKFDDIQETVPVEVVTDNQFNQIMKGEKTAKEVRPDAVATAEPPSPQAVAQPQQQPTPEKAQAPPPPPPPPMPPVRDVQDKPAAVTPPPPQPDAPLPPPRPEPPQPDATPPVPMPPVRDVSAEPDLPKPVPKPAPKPVVKPPPLPPVVPHPVVAKVVEPKPVPKPTPKPVEKPKPDQVAKLMETLPTETAAAVPPSPSKSRLTQASSTSKFDPTDISKLLSSGAPAQRASAAHDRSQVASLGSPTASAPKMSPSFWAGLDGVMEDQYRQCWSYLGLNTGVKYVPQIRVVYASNGMLEGEPVLVNPPSDPALRSLADSALRAVRRCNPLKIPDQYAPYYDQWKGRVLRFDPEEMAG